MDYKYLSVEDTGIEIKYTEKYIKTIRGPRGSCGEPEGPDQDILQYSVDTITIMGIKITLKGLQAYYMDIGDLESDIYMRVETIISNCLQ